MKVYKRLQICPAPGVSFDSSKLAHCELYNPPGSGVYVVPIEIVVMRSTSFEVLGRKSDTMMSQSFATESRGIPMWAFPVDDTDPAYVADDYYSKAHARCQATASNAYLEGGMVEKHDQPTAAPVKLQFTPAEVADQSGKWVFPRKPGTGLMVRSCNNGQPLLVNFTWAEIPITA